MFEHIVVQIFPQVAQKVAVTAVLLKNGCFQNSPKIWQSVRATYLAVSFGKNYNDCHEITL